jgi:hypothetical protein
MYYYWLIPILVLAALAVFAFASASRKKANTGPPVEEDKTEALKRGKYLNK